MENLRKRIVELPKTVADKIAAGEVVDRPLSIVKELVENAIDAGSTSIIVEIKNGGKSYIRVTDNGCGIAKEEVELAFKRHATSKIKEAVDLDHITSLGFRGEALASIAAVSRTELITKTSDEKIGISIKIEGGEIAEKVDTGCPDGTTIIISDLFYNTPARLKFLKPDSTESTLIIDFMSKLSLAYPSIKIRLINNGSILFSTPGKNDIYTNILTIYSKELGNQLIHFKEDSGEVSVEGFISSPSYSKTNRKSQIFFVNGRYISSKLLDFAVMDGYAEKLFDKRYPIAFLFLTVAPEKLDVNIHPNKKEVRFDDEKLIKEFIANSIKKHLNTKEAIPEVKVENIFKLRPVAQKIDVAEDKKDFSAETMTEKETKVTNTIKEEQVDIKKLLFERRKSEEQKVEEKTEKTSKEKDFKEFEYEEQEENSSVKDNLVQENSIDGEFKKSYPQLIELSKKIGDFCIDEIMTTGSIFGTYITAVDEDYFYLIDQHAAHERIFYEQLLMQYQKEEKLRQTILVPFVVNITYAAKNDSFNWLDFLGNIGYDIEEFGPKAYIVKGIPMFMELDGAKDFLEDFLDNVDQDTDFQDQKKIDRIISNSCKKAVKAHDLLNKEEINQLMMDLAKCKNPYSCPHGRPTFIKMSKYEIEKMFKRV